MSGVERIAEAFEAARADGRRAALMPYMMGGYPDLERSREVLRACVEGGASLIELGVPFSDPLADGPVIQAAGGVALRAGVSVHDVFDLARVVAADVPVVLMCYANQVVIRGLERFADSLVSAGVCGLIVPDLPLEEAGGALEICDQRELALVPLIAPTTPEERIHQIGSRARGFVYAVSLTGTTGERAGLTQSVPGLLARVRSHTNLPVAVGFGIGTPEQARAAADAGADGVIVGSRLVRAAGEADDPAPAVGALVAEFADALGAGIGSASE